ncbi:Protein of unknown function [Bacillus cereus]|uniref:Uncharacterized protein n=1 Tax=Bacillus wiedmannii TaxID=1890302 RepID=A0AB37YYG0_9BACI|nr:Protein of unknown function [Bacillus wiedmannii]SCC61257.1 Protein of unknown function [Bacillus cereus]SCM06537.1 Protein of unknown function [Bacillus wiedmannii]SCN08241.1 Protein of unknown function [Bacillus wiedmannii]SCN36347.1 Protein of unknown function [Bacillus cereus]
MKTVRVSELTAYKL